jgi:hypothetical protein
MSVPDSPRGEQLPESSDLRTLLAQIQQSVADEHDSLAKARGSEGGLAVFRGVLCELRLRVEHIRNCFLEYQRAIDRLYILGSAPREAIRDVDTLVRTNLEALDGLVWDLPRPRKEAP